MNFIGIAPKEKVTYCKETQTPATEATDKNAKPLDYHELTEDENTSISVATSTSTGKESKTRSKAQAEKSEKSNEDKSIDDRLKQLKNTALNEEDVQPEVVNPGLITI